MTPSPETAYALAQLREVRDSVCTAIDDLIEGELQQAVGGLAGQEDKLQRVIEGLLFSIAARREKT